MTAIFYRHRIPDTVTKYCHYDERYSHTIEKYETTKIKSGRSVTESAVKKLSKKYCHYRPYWQYFLVGVSSGTLQVNWNAKKILSRLQNRIAQLLKELLCEHVLPSWTFAVTLLWHRNCCHAKIPSRNWKYRHSNKNTVTAIKIQGNSKNVPSLKQKYRHCQQKYCHWQQNTINSASKFRNAFKSLQKYRHFIFSPSTKIVWVMEVSNSFEVIFFW